MLFHSFVSVPPFPSPSPLPPSLSPPLFVASLQYAATVCCGRYERQRVHTPFPSSLQNHLSPSRIIPLPRLVAPLVIESATRRYAAQGFVAHVGVLVCEFRGIVSVDHFPASIGTRGIGSLGWIEIPFVLVSVERYRLGSSRFDALPSVGDHAA